MLAMLTTETLKERASASRLNVVAIAATVVGSWARDAEPTERTKTALARALVVLERDEEALSRALERLEAVR